MIKKEIAEIKRQFTPANCSISRICGCYVDGEKNKKADFKEAFLSLPEEDMFKYFELLRKNLSGTLGKNLINLEFPLAAEEEGGPHEFLLKPVSYTHLDVYKRQGLPCWIPRWSWKSESSAESLHGRCV